MNELCKVCINDCKDDYRKITDDGSYCYDWVSFRRMVKKIEQENPYWWVEAFEDVN
jgi:hypothetical protein